MDRLKVQKPVENTNDFIRVKQSYIYIPLFARIVFGICVYSVLLFVFLLLYLFLVAEFSIPLPYELGLSFALATAVLLSLPVVFSEKILKRFCDRWRYSRFLWVQRFAKMLALLSILCIVGLYLAAQFYESLPLWSLFLYLGSLVTFIYATPFVGFFSLIGGAVISFKSFLKEFENKSGETDFGKLAEAAKKVSKIAENYNMQISPNQLGLAMTVSFINDREVTKKDFEVLIEWIEDPTKQENFKRFCEIIKKYNLIVKKSAEEGIRERYHWSFERIATFMGATVIPLSIAIIAHVVPKILEMLG